MNNIYQERRNKLMTQLDNHSIVLLHSGKPLHKSYDEYYPFYPSMDFYYLTGLNDDNVILMLVKEENAIKEFLFVTETTEYMRLWLGEKISKQEASSITGIDVKQIMWIKQFEDFFHNTMHFTRTASYTIPSYLFVDLFHYNKELVSSASTYFNRQITEYPNLTIKNVNEYIYIMRMNKDESEVNALREAIRITDTGLQRIMKEIPQRSYEYQLEADFLHQIRLEGATELSFKTIAACGTNATVLHYEENNDSLDSSKLILFDLGAKFNYYSADISRTYPLNGTFNKRQKDIYNLVLKANKECINAVKPGLTWPELNKLAIDILTEGAKELGILKDDEAINKYYYHSVGHFLGLDTHDVGAYGKPLEPGMVITIEPGLYIKEEGIGVRIEDNILVTEDGHINLSKDIIKEIKDIEDFMKQ